MGDQFPIFSFLYELGDYDLIVGENIYLIFMKIDGICSNGFMVSCVLSD